MFFKHLILDVAGFIIGFVIWQIAKCTDNKIGKALIICALFVFINYIILILGLSGKASGILWVAEIGGIFIGWLAGKRKAGLSEIKSPENNVYWEQHNKSIKNQSSMGVKNIFQKYEFLFCIALFLFVFANIFYEIFLS